MTLSKIVVTGTVANNPEKRFTQTNIPILSFTLDINPDDSSIVRVIKFGAQAEALADDLHAGDSVIVEGRPQVASYSDENGKEKRTIEINAQVVEKTGAGAVSSGAKVSNANASSSSAKSGDIVQFAESEAPESLIDEEEIPF